MRKKNSSIIRLIAYAGKTRLLLLAALLLGLLGTALSLGGPILTGRVINGITDGIKQAGRVDTDYVMPLLIIVIIMKVLQFLAEVAQRMSMVFVTTKVTRNVRSVISDKLDRLPMKFYFENSIGDILSRVTNDVDIVNQNLTQCTINIAGSFIAIIATLILMLVYDPLMTAACVGMNLLQLVIVSGVALKSSKYYAKQMQVTGAVNGYIEENYSGHGIILAYNAEKKSERQFGDLNEELKKSAFSAQAISGLAIPLSSSFVYLSTMLLLILGLSLSLNGSRSLGLVITFIGFNNCLSAPVNTLVQSLQPMVSTKAALARIFSLIDAEELSKDSEKELPEEIRGNVTFEHVKFGYNDDRIIIKDFSKEIRHGQKVAIVGPTGAGKSTLINLLMRFYEVNEGTIYVDGTDISTVSRKSLRDKFSIVLQDPWIFEDTILENLTFGKGTEDMQKIDAAVKAVGLDYMISTLPEKYETVLDEHLALSNGQRQQLCIARAIIADKPIVILDEATSSIDTRTEIAIQRAMDQLMEGRTSFVIAHRLSTIVNADVILVLKDGDICESGNHKELLEKKGLYYELYNSQFEE